MMPMVRFRTTTYSVSHWNRRRMVSTQPFNVLVHSPQDHRYVSREEVSEHSYFQQCMSNSTSSSISEFVRVEGVRFLRSTSKWTEKHLFAFKCLWLDNLPVSRVIPSSFIPTDDDPTVQLVRQELSATEDEVRSRTVTPGMAYSFYLKLAQVLQRPASPEPIPIPSRNILQNSLESLYQISAGMSGSTDSRYVPPGPVMSRNVAALPSVPEQNDGNQPQAITHVNQRMSRSPILRRSFDWQRDPDRMSVVGSDGGSRLASTSDQSTDSIEEDKLESLSKQMVATFLELLAAMEYQKRGGKDTRVEFRCFPSWPGLTDSISPLKPVLVILGRVINSVNDGGFFVERRSVSRPMEWVRRDRVPLVSLEVSESL